MRSDGFSFRSALFGAIGMAITFEVATNENSSSSKEDILSKGQAIQVEQKDCNGNVYRIDTLVAIPLHASEGFNSNALNHLKKGDLKMTKFLLPMPH